MCHHECAQGRLLDTWGSAGLECLRLWAEQRGSPGLAVVPGL